MRSEDYGHTKTLPKTYDNIAEDGSEIRKLLSVQGASMVHCTLPPRAVSRASRNVGAEEIWYFLGGQGEVWRKGESREPDPVSPGVCLTISAGVDFQFRNIGEEPLMFLCVTTPAWKPEQNVPSEDHRWSATGVLPRSQNCQPG